MDRYQRISSIALATSVGVAVMIGKYVNDWASEQNLSSAVSIMLVLGVVAIITRLVRFGLDEAFERSILLRKILLGTHFVEGTWVELVRRERDVIGMAVTYVGSTGYNVQYSGENYDVEGRPSSTFRADMVRLDWPVLKYKHTNQPSHGPAGSLEGYAEIQFMQRGKPPIRYIGFFAHLPEDVRYNVIASRVTDPKVRERLDIQETRRETVMEIGRAMMVKEDLKVKDIA